MAAEQKENQTDKIIEGEEVQDVEAEQSAAATPEQQPEIEEPLAEASVEDALRQENENLQQQVKDNLEKALLAQAEMENLRKRTARDMENAHKFALDKFTKELLPVIDSLELGLFATDTVEDTDSLKQGMDLTLKKFLDVMQKFGVSVVEAEGEKFDPEKHEAISMQEVDDAEPGTVITVIQKGYELNGRLIRPAMVIVSRNKNA
ncbi:MAG: nucleotide exchange factor GrpE [Gammaproteobacteria bacterium]|nr:nucleotide exchange factor GrpE [Gammaproteobacteria bacterium]